MALTIRDTEEHDKMLETLKKLTGQKAASKAVIDGGYLAVEKSKVCDRQEETIRKLERELSDLKWQVKDFFGSMDKLRTLGDKS